MSEVDRNERGSGRREFIALGVGALILLSAPGLERLQTVRRLYRRSARVRRVIPVMGTTAEIVVVHTDVRDAHDAIDAAFERLRLVERTLTWFRQDSDVGRVNLLAMHEAVPVSDLAATVLKESLRWAEATDGRFDPCLGKAVSLWDVTNRNAPPEPARVKLLAARRLFTALDLDTWLGRPAVRLTNPDAAIDLGGIGKGFGVDQAVGVLRERGIRSALVNVGGDLYAIGRSENGDPWRIGVRSPANPNGTVATLEVEDAAVATSGDYLQYFEHGGHRYHHLLDPLTGAPRAGTMRSLTVRADACMTADAAATAAFGLPPSAVNGMLRRASRDAFLAHSILHM